MKENVVALDSACCSVLGDAFADIKGGGVLKVCRELRLPAPSEVVQIQSFRKGVSGLLWGLPKQS